MGAGNSKLNCTSKRKDKRKNKKKDSFKDKKKENVQNRSSQSRPDDIIEAAPLEDKSATPKTLQDQLVAYEDKVEELRTKGSEVARRVNPLDQELVQDQIKKREKKYESVRSRAERLQNETQVLELDLEEIQGKVDQYLAWLQKKAEQVELTRPEGYMVDDAQERCHYINNLCQELENRQFTLDTVSKKVEAVLQDLSPKDREEMEQTAKSLTKEHQRVYEIAVAQKNLLAESLNAREVFQVGLDRVNVWMDEREKKIEELEKPKLLAAEVEKQAEKIKTLQLELEKFEPQIEQVESRVRTLQQDCQPNQSQELELTLKDVKQRFSNLKDQMKTTSDKLQTGLATRKVNEQDLHKVEKWCKEAEMKCAVEPTLDCATEVLNEQCQQYKTLDTSAQMFSSLLKEVKGRCDSLAPTLAEADAAALQQMNKSTQDKFNKLSMTIKERIVSLEEALQTRDQVGDGITEMTDWLQEVQNTLRTIPKTVGPTVNEAEDILRLYEAAGEKIANYQPTVMQLNQAVERLRSLGQVTEADEILRLTNQYEMLGDQVKQQTKKYQQAMVARQQLDDQIKEVDNIIRECEQTADSTIGVTVPVPDKIEKLKSVSTQLQSAGPTLFSMGDRAQQIGLEGTGDDARAVSTMVDDIKSRVDNLKKIADRKTKQCESIQKNREDFDTFVNDTTTWLDSKEEVLASCGTLDLDPKKVKSSLQKHQALARDARDKLDTIKMKAEIEKSHYDSMDEPIPSQLSEKLAQVNMLEDSIKTAVAKKEQYLTEAAADRMQLELSMKQINDWIQGAEEMLDSGYEGLDYSTLNDTISEHKDYFSEASMCQDEVEQVMELSERLLPTLDMNDTETLRQSLKNTNQKLANIMASSQRQQQEMEKKAAEWNQYQDTVMQVTSDLHLLEDEWEALDNVPLSTPSNINKHLVDTKQFIDKMESLRPLINEVNERSHDLDRDATGKSKPFIQQLLGEVNDRWKTLIANTENKQMALQDLEVQYEDYSNLLTTVDQLLDQAEAAVPATIDVDQADGPQLVAHLSQAEALSELMETTEPKLTALKKCAQQLQKNLPTAEAKVQSQDIVMAMLEKFERLQDVGKEQKSVLQEEIEDREGFNAEASQTLGWLTETKAELDQLEPSMVEPEVMEKMEKLKTSEQEISIRMQQMRHMAQLQETKYRSQGRDIPAELQNQILLMNDLEKEVTTTMATKEEELLHLKADRQVYSTELRLVTTWLSQAQDELQERVMDVPQAASKHNELLSEFDPFKTKLDSLRTKGGNLIQHTSDPVEKHTIQKTLADVNRQWSSVQANAGERTKQLSEAQELSNAFAESSEAIEAWATQAEATLSAEPSLVDFERVREQLKTYKKLVKDLDQQQNKLGHLNAVVKKMEPLCDTDFQMQQVSDLSHKAFDLRSRAVDKVNELEDVEEQIQDYEVQLAELKQWMEKTRAHLTLRDETLTLKDQLEMQESLIEDIDSHKGKALFVLNKHAELHAQVGEESRLHNTHLAAEINTLLEQAYKDREELREAVVQQELYETEMQSLSSSITEAQARLIGSPIQASSVKDLKEQISERNELAQQIKLYQARINELHQKSHCLAERSADLGPLLARKLFHSGDKETRVMDLVNTMNAPLEPYVSPRASPVSPESSLRFQYENPLQLYKGKELGPVVTSQLEGVYHAAPALSMAQRREAGKSLPALNGHSIPPTIVDRIDPSVDVSGLKRNRQSKGASLPDVTRSQSGAKPADSQTSFGTDTDRERSQADSGVNLSSQTSVKSLSPGRQPLDDSAETADDSMEISIEVPNIFATPGIRAHSSDRSDDNLQVPRKSMRLMGDRESVQSFDLGSVLSGSTNEPPSSVSHLDQADSSSLSSYPVSVQGTIVPGQQDKPDAGQEVTEEFVALRQRKIEALNPYVPRSKFMSKPGVGSKPASKDDNLPTRGREYWRGRDSQGLHKGPIKGDHNRVEALQALDRLTDTPGSTNETSKPPLTFDISKSHPNLSARSTEGQLDHTKPASSIDALHRHSRSVSPADGKVKGLSPRGHNGDKDRLSTSLTSGQLRSMSPKRGHFKDRHGMPNTGSWNMDISRSVPSLLDPHLQGLQDRSSSIGSRSRLGGSRSRLSGSGSLFGSRSSKFDELNSSWQNLQRQLGTKERELQVALQKQERYQSTVQDVTARMDRLQQKLASLAVSPFKDVDKQVREQREAETEIDSIREDIARVKERGRQIMETTDPEGYQAMTATLSMLTDKIDNLQAMADNKAKTLQNAMKGKERHVVAMEAYKKHIGEIERWMQEMKVRQAATPLATDSVSALQLQLQENKDLQNELNHRLQHVADLAIQCDNLCEMETPESADKLRSQLATLQKDLGDLKLAAIEKQAPLRSTIKESEKRSREMADYESNVKNLQKWISDTKMLAQAAPGPEQMVTMTPREKQELQQQLQSDLFQHRNLVRQLSSEMRTRDSRAPREATLSAPLVPLKEEDLQPRWETLSRDMEHKKANLKDLINKTNEMIGPSKLGRRNYSVNTSLQLNDIRRHLGALNDLWQQLQVQVDDKQLRLDKALEFQQRYQDALQNVSGWLDIAEQKLFAPDSTMNSEEKVKENEDIQREIRSLQGEIHAMGHAANELLKVTNADTHDLIRHSLGNLNDRVRILESQAKDQGEKLRSVDRNYKLYQDEVVNLETKLGETRDMMASPGPSAPVRQQVDKMQEAIGYEQKIEGQMKKCETQLEGLKKRQSELSALDPQIISPYEMDTLQTNFMDLQQKVMEKKASLQESVSVQEQYEKLLNDYADFLDTAEDKLKTEQISARDLDHLKQQLIAHKDFFSDLEVHRAMLDSLVAQCDKATKQKHLPQHTRLSNLTYVLQDKASLHGQRLERLVKQWAEMEEKFNQLQRFLHDMESHIPKPISNDDTLQSIQTKMNTYQRLQRELTEEKPMVFQVVDKGKQLLHSINCPALEMLITDLADKWVDLNTELSHELKKSQSLGDQLQVFEAEASILKSWLSAARSKLTSIKQLSSADMKSIATIRSKIDKILEFRKDVENQQTLKDKVLSIGKQLAQSQVYQTSDLEDRMRFLEHEWAHLEHDITNTEEYLHQAQMDLMPSRQALGELNAWLTEIEETLRDEKNKPLKNLADMEILLKKYKSYKIDLTSKQLTVDFVNQEVLQPREDVDGPPPAETNEFSERLGTLNNRWREVSRHVSDRLKALEGIQSKWEEFEKCVARLIGWIHEQEDKLKKYRLIGHEVSVRQTLKDVKTLQLTIKTKQIEVNHVQELGDSLIQLSEESPQVRECIQDSVRNINTQKQSLDTNTAQVHQLLEDILGQWDSYHSELQAVGQTLSETEYCLQRYNLIGGDIATLKIQVEKLENLLADMDRHVTRHEKFSNLSTRLAQVCEQTTRQEIKKVQNELQNRWQNVFAELSSRTEKFRDCLRQWLKYEDEYSAARTWLDAKEKLCEELVYGKEARSRRDANLANCQNLQRDLDTFQTQLANLYRAGDSVTKNMDPSSIVNVTSKLSGLEQRLITLRQKLAKHIQSLQGDLSQQRKFQDAFDQVKAFLMQAQRILNTEDPNKSADEKTLSDRLEHLKDLLTQFHDNSGDLDNLNELGYRLALNETAAAELQDLNHKWHELFMETKERCKGLQGMLLVQQDFQSKCDTWMTFLAQTESDLSTEIVGNLIDLLAQQKKCEKFEAEMYSRQQILHAIISDGQTMMNEGDIDNKEEFQQKLVLLADQWQSVVRRANQRKSIIDSTVKQWQSFNDMAEKLRTWLAEKEEGLQVFNFDTASLQKVKNLMEKAKNTQHEFKLQEDLFKNMNSQGKQLVQRADDRAQEELRVSMAQLQQHWHQTYVRYDEEREKLDGVLKQWGECEDDIEEILTWLKETRKSLSAGLPTAYQDLTADMHKCKDIETAFVNAEPKRKSLLANERSLSKTIEPEDLNVLHQRIRLLNKQWDELRNQATLRSQKIDDTMFRWSSFSEKFKELCDWIDRMEVKVISSKDFHIEDLLNRMERDFKDELSEKEKAKNELVGQGRALIQISNEVRASDIEQKVQRLEDKWDHLKAVVGFRQRKLQETLLAVQQLDVSMSNLRKWLTEMEHALSAPVTYQECDRREIQKKLKHQSELQHDIERHSPGVGSVLNLCEVLLHDSDACPTDIEFNGLQTAMKNLERRWRSICQMAPEQRSRIEETWQLWQTLMDDCRSFSEWLTVMEEEVVDVTTDQLNVSISKEEFEHCESLRRKIHENLSSLENINRQYRRLAREGRTDTAGTLKTMMQEANDRWDSMQGQVSANLRQLKHSSSIREDFKRTRDSLLGWLTEVDMQLTNIEHLSSMNVPTKIREMQRIQEEIDARARKFDFLDEAGLYLIQKGDSTDAITTQAELDTFRQYHRKVLDRVAITSARLSALQTEDRLHLDEDELDRLERELYALGPDDPYTLEWDMKEIEAYLESSPPESPPEKRRALLKKLRERSRSRSQSPKKLPAVTAATHSPVRTSSPRFRRKEDTSFESQRTGRGRAKSPRRVARDFVDSRSPRAPSPSRQERFNRMKSELSNRGKEAQVEAILEKLADALEDAADKLDTLERELNTEVSAGPGVEQRSAAYTKSMTEAEKSVDDVRQIQRLLKSETGLHSIVSADNQVEAILQRWEMLQASSIQKDYRLSQQRQDWTQFQTDLNNMLTWLNEAEKLQLTHKPLPGEITHLDSIIRQHKDFLVQLEAKKPRVISINLTSRELIDAGTEEGRQLRDKLKMMNRRWDVICTQATSLQHDLQRALMQCQEFHHTIHDMLLWLEGVESKLHQCEPIKLGNDESALWTRLRKLQDIKFDLEKNQPRVITLKELAEQLLMNCESPEMSQSKDKMNIIANRLKALLRLCSSYISSLETRLDSKSSVRSPDRSLDLSVSPSSSGAPSPRDFGMRTSTPTRSLRSPFRPQSITSSRPRTRSPFALSRQFLSGVCRFVWGIFRPFTQRSRSHLSDLAEETTSTEHHETRRGCPLFISRVLRLAIPLQLLLLLLLALASLVPMTEEDYSCILANNFRRSLDPMLHYTDGPPPV